MGLLFLSPLLSLDACDKPSSPKTELQSAGIQSTDARGEGFAFNLPGDWKREAGEETTSWISQDGTEQVVAGSVILKEGAAEKLDGIFKRLLDHRMTAIRSNSPSVVFEPLVENDEGRGRIARINGRDGNWRFAFLQIGRGRVIAYLQYETTGSMARADEIFSTLRLE